MLIWVDPKQKQIVESRARFVTWMASRRRGKSKAIRARFVKRAFGEVGRRLCYATPFAAQSWQEYAWYRYHPTLGPLLSKHGCKTQPFPHLTVEASGSVMEFRTLENADGMRGGEFDDVVIDESQSIKILREEFQSIVSPMLKDRRGRLTICGQPRGKNWIYEDYYLKGLPGSETYDPDYFSLLSTWHECFCFQGPEGRREAEKERLTVALRVWLQEYECAIEESGSTVFTFVDRCVSTDFLPHLSPQPGCVYLLFWDLGKTEDHAAVMVMEKFSGLVCVAEELPLGLGYSEALKYVIALQKYYNAACALDLTGAGPRDQGVLDLVKERLPGMRGIYFGTRHKESLVNQADVELEQVRVRIHPRFAKLVSQLKRYEFERDPIEDFYKYHAPIGEHDDLVATLLGVLDMRSKNWGPSPGGVALRHAIG